MINKLKRSFKSKIFKGSMTVLLAMMFATNIYIANKIKKEVEEKDGIIEILRIEIKDSKNDLKEKEEEVENVKSEKEKSEKINNNTINELDKSLKDQKLENDELVKKLSKAIAIKKAEKERNEAKKSLSDTPPINKQNAVENSFSDTLYGGNTITVQATAYDGVSLGGFTASGYQIQGYDDKVIAVDPNIIPLGSTVYVPGYGTAIAADTGGAIQGNIIDLNMSTADAIQWGRRIVTIRIG